ncbi:hypothetical protein PH213_16900 [Streptomyces sp. SRF1]|uniref:hypothetical protein n=1 Tax=Streptomyces sp. SRF1 TaxID=1549642 RepID=UPI0025AFC72F|nr:hypothetical protein [Streptomyces sp. SRF1]MDN3056194.1 hypothetical protein [Streptomyces sp. SRF1]
MSDQQKKPARKTPGPEQARASLAGYLADRPQLATFARDMLRAFEEFEADDARARLAAAGAARKEWKKYEPHVPELILDARDAGASGAEIAADLGMNPSYVFRILREKGRYSYRLDVFDDPDIGPGWQAEENGDGSTDVDDKGAFADPAALVEEIRQGCLGERRAHLRARVLLWKGPDLGPDDAAAYVREWPSSHTTEQ